MALSQDYRKWFAQALNTYEYIQACSASLYPHPEVISMLDLTFRHESELMDIQELCRFGPSPPSGCQRLILEDNSSAVTLKFLDMVVASFSRSTIPGLSVYQMILKLKPYVHHVVKIPCICFPLRFPLSEFSTE